MVDCDRILDFLDAVDNILDAYSLGFRNLTEDTPLVFEHSETLFSTINRFVFFSPPTIPYFLTHSSSISEKEIYNYLTNIFSNEILAHPELAKFGVDTLSGLGGGFLLLGLVSPQEYVAIPLNFLLLSATVYFKGGLALSDTPEEMALFHIYKDFQKLLTPCSSNEEVAYRLRLLYANPFIYRLPRPINIYDVFNSAALYIKAFLIEYLLNIFKYGDGRLLSAESERLISLIEGVLDKGTLPIFIGNKEIIHIFKLNTDFAPTIVSRDGLASILSDELSDGEKGLFLDLVDLSYNLAKPAFAGELEALIRSKYHLEKSLIEGKKEVSYQLFPISWSDVEEADLFTPTGKVIVHPTSPFRLEHQMKNIDILEVSGFPPQEVVVVELDTQFYRINLKSKSLDATHKQKCNINNKGKLFF